MAVYETFRKAVDDVRAGKGPVLIESVTYRWFGHSSSDPGKYRTKEESGFLEGKRSNIKFRNRLIEEGIATEEELTKLEENSKQKLKKQLILRKTVQNQLLNQHLRIFLQIN